MSALGERAEGERAERARIAERVAGMADKSESRLEEPMGADQRLYVMGWIDALKHLAETLRETT